MQINFLVPTTGLTGGIKIIFQHANNLVNLGHKINVIYPYVLEKDANYKNKLLGWIKRWKRIMFKIFLIDEIKWFKLNSEIKLLRVPNLCAKYIPIADITIATANETADWIVDYPENRGQKVYFIQDYEYWTRDVKKVDNTYKYPLIRITVSNYLKKFLENKFNINIHHVILNGVDLKKFNNNKKKINKNKKFLMMYHTNTKKGTEDGMKAFEIAKVHHSEISLVLYGAYKLSREMKNKYKYYYQPKSEILGKLFSQSDIFLWPSRVEGFGIPPMEAMACKCSVIATDTGAIKEYTIPNKTAIIIPPGKPEVMAEKIIELVNDESRLEEMSILGYNYIKQFSIQKSSKELEKFLLNIK